MIHDEQLQDGTENLKFVTPKLMRERRLSLHCINVAIFFGVPVRHVLSCPLLQMTRKLHGRSGDFAHMLGDVYSKLFGASCCTTCCPSHGSPIYLDFKSRITLSRHLSSSISREGCPKTKPIDGQLIVTHKS